MDLTGSLPLNAGSASSVVVAASAGLTTPGSTTIDLTHSYALVTDSNFVTRYLKL